jgi:hypothetical protein
LSGGRLGDNLLSYLHARWIAYRNHVPLVFKPFPQAEEFALAKESRHPAIASQVEIPYFPEPSMKNQNLPFTIDWDDPEFHEEIVQCLSPTKSHNILELPADRITVCVHIRRGGTFDSPSSHKEFPLKFPPDSYYIEQIRTIARIFQGKPLYVFLMTDDLHPEALVQRYKKAVTYPNIQWDCRKNPPENDLDDFFSIPHFDCLVLCDSNFSIVASKLTQYAIRIAPTHYSKKNGTVFITGLEITFNPAYKKIDASHEKILIAGICRNTEKATPSIIQNAEKLGKRFKDYAVLIYENNSTDRTAEQYAAWARRNSRVVFVSEAIQSPNASRTERIANARNEVLFLAKRPEYADFKYILMVDLDLVSPWPIDQIIRTIERGGDWDMVSANGMYPNGDYYDRYALRNSMFPLGPELLGAWWRMQLERTPARINQDRLLPVFSAFGGMAIYKTQSLLPAAYSGMVNHYLRDYYKQILLTYYRKKKNPQIQEYVRQLGIKETASLKAVPVVFVENTPEEHPEDLRRVSCCEHVTLHAEMATNGHGKFFIDPKMVLMNIPQQTKP